MEVIKSLFLAGFMLATAFAKPQMATLEVQSNFDFSLTRKEFRVHYSGLGDFSNTDSDSVTIKIYKSGETSPKHAFPVADKNEKKIYQFALENTDDGKYEVEVCAGETCSDKNAALTDINPVTHKKITCNRVQWKNGRLQDSTDKFEADFFGPGQDDWIATDNIDKIQEKINTALTQAGKTANYQTEFKKLDMTANPQYKHEDRIFYAAVTYEISRFKQLFDKLRKESGEEGMVYAHELCERKYLLSAHAHIVDKTTKEVRHRFKTTLFLSEGGKQSYVLSANPDKVHVEMTHKGELIEADTYDLWITFCATEKDAIESTFCAEPLIKHDFQVTH